MPSCSSGLGFFLFSSFCLEASTAFSCKKCMTFIYCCLPCVFSKQQKRWMKYRYPHITIRIIIYANRRGCSAVFGPLIGSTDAGTCTCSCHAARSRLTTQVLSISQGGQYFWLLLDAPSTLSRANAQSNQHLWLLSITLMNR
jgi:hypothetical protein